MKITLSLIPFLILISCSDSENSAKAPAAPSAPVDAKSAPAPTEATIATSESTIFEAKACRFLTEGQIKETLGDQINAVSIEPPRISQRASQKRFTLTLANGTALNLVFSIGPDTPKGIEKAIREYTDNAKNLSRLIKMEMAADGQTHIATHISQRLLFVLGSGQNSVPRLTYDVRGNAGGQTPEEIEARRQMGLSLINKMLKE